jgi:hypothetical protein
MKNQLILLACAAVFSFGATLAAPVQAAAQCVWGCTCMGDACGCNSNGSGSRCDTGGDGCVVSRCTERAYFAPDGSIVRFAADDPATPGRWEWVAEGREVERTCNGLVLARRFAPAVAAAIRQDQRLISL